MLFATISNLLSILYTTGRREGKENREFSKAKVISILAKCYKLMDPRGKCVQLIALRMTELF